MNESYYRDLVREVAREQNWTYIKITPMSGSNIWDIVLGVMGYAVFLELKVYPNKLDEDGGQMAWGLEQARKGNLCLCLQFKPERSRKGIKEERKQWIRYNIVNHVIKLKKHMESKCIALPVFKELIEC